VTITPNATGNFVAGGGTTSGTITIGNASTGASTFGNTGAASVSTFQGGSGAAGQSILTSAGTGANALLLNASGTAGSINMTANTTGNITLTQGTTSGVLTLGSTASTGGVTVQGAGTTTITSSKVAVGATTVSSTGGTTATTLVTSNGTGASAVNITSTGVNSGITLAPNGTGVVTVSGNAYATAFFYSSDRRLKENFSAAPGLDAILKLNGVRFNWIKDGTSDIGLIAQEVEEVFPELVDTNRVTGYKAVKYGNLVSPLIESTKELYGMCKASEEQMRSIASVVDDMQVKLEKVIKENQELREELKEIRQMLKAREK